MFTDRCTDGQTDGHTDGWMDIQMDGQTTDGRQAHCYIPRTFQSGDKKLKN